MNELQRLRKSEFQAYNEAFEHVNHAYQLATRRADLADQRITVSSGDYTKRQTARSIPYEGSRTQNDLSNQDTLNYDMSEARRRGSELRRIFGGGTTIEAKHPGTSLVDSTCTTPRTEIVHHGGSPIGQHEAGGQSGPSVMCLEDITSTQGSSYIGKNSPWSVTPWHEKTEVADSQYTDDELK